jgi:hypothetical protein
VNKIGYCTIDDVRAVVDSDMLDVEIEVLIDIATAMIKNMVTSADAQILRGICQTWVALRVMLKDPASRRLGEYAEDRTETLRMLRSELSFMIAHATTTGGIAVVPAREELG